MPPIRNSNYQQCVSECDKEKTISDSIGFLTQSVGRFAIFGIIAYLLIIIASYGFLSFLPFTKKMVVL